MLLIAKGLQCPANGPWRAQTLQRYWSENTAEKCYG